jgi:hypothetical protein
LRCCKGERLIVPVFVLRWKILKNLLHACHE